MPFSDLWTTFKAGYKRFEKIMHAFGNVVSAVFLMIFYYTVFALFAIPFRLSRKKNAIPSSFEKPHATFGTPEAFREEF
ncbi:MAG: hypothetical protein WC787_02970 [Patescibacteria group bacterium]|jgi:hypothetical protein